MTSSPAPFTNLHQTCSCLEVATLVRVGSKNSLLKHITMKLHTCPRNAKTWLISAYSTWLNLKMLFLEQGLMQNTHWICCLHDPKHCHIQNDDCRMISVHVNMSVCQTESSQQLYDLDCCCHCNCTDVSKINAISNAGVWHFNETSLIRIRQ